MPSTTSSSAQKLGDDISKDSTSEREALLLAENKTLETRNSALHRRVIFLEAEVEKLKKEEGREVGGGRRGAGGAEYFSFPGSGPIAALPSCSSAISRALASAFSTSSMFRPSRPQRSSIMYSSSQSPPPLSAPPRSPSSLDVFPNEILSEILHHLHQPFHFYHYSNALLGISNPYRRSKPWNPVGLQLVCRRWKDVARPLFYRQVAFDLRDEATLDLADHLASETPNHPFTYARTSVWIDVASDLTCGRAASRLLHEMVTSTPNHRFLALYLQHSRLRFTGRSCLSESLVFSRLYSEDIRRLLKVVGSWWDGAREDEGWNWDSHLIHPNHLLAFRLTLADLPSLLAAVLQTLHLIANLPRLQLDFPFDLSPSLLETIFPTLAAILQHPSLPEGRDFILKHTGNVKKIIFGTHSEGDASDLRGKIEELGQLEVVVEVVVLEL